MKRWIALFLLLALLTGCGSSAKPVTEEVPQPDIADSAMDFSQDAELERAFLLGLIPEGWGMDTLETQVTCGEFCQLLSKSVSLCDPAAAAAFETQAAAQLKDREPIYDYDQVMAVYMAACAMGIGETANGDWLRLRYVTRKWSRENLRAFHDFCFEPSPFFDVEWAGRQPGFENEWGGVSWLMAQFSAVSGRNILDCEQVPQGSIPEREPPVEDSPMTRDEAVRAALRLYESTLSPIVAEATDAEVLDIYKAVDARREAILNCETAIVRADTWEQGKTYSGTAYYVCADGSDSNNGRSPETPWKTLDKVNKARLKKGDAVFFHRGDTWHGSLIGYTGVTYSAYGEGAKPILTGSIPDIAKAENWLLHSEKNGVKIWVYKEPLSDVTGMFMNGNSLWAEKLMPGWDGNSYVNRDGTPFLLEEAFTEDLTYLSMLDLSGEPLFAVVEDRNRSGPLYLRCDAGNPGEVFSDIQFATDAEEGFTPDRLNSIGITLDNLALYHYGRTAISIAGYLGTSGALVQNCEIAWCGGMIKNYVPLSEQGYSIPICSGGAVQISGTDNRVINNYIHDCDNKVFINVMHYLNEDSPTTYDNVRISGNLVERSGSALLLLSCLREEGKDATGVFRNHIFEDNYVMHTGEGWIQKKLLKEDVYKNGGCLSSIDGSGLLSCLLDDVQIKNNVFGNSSYALVGLAATSDTEPAASDDTDLQENNYPVFSGNTYLQYENGWAAQVEGRMIAITENGAEAIARELGDTAAKVLLMQ